MDGRKFDLLGSGITWDIATDRYNSLRADYYLVSQDAEMNARMLFQE